MTSTNDEQRRQSAKPTKRAKIMRGIVAPIFGLLAVASLAFGLLNATIWKPSANVTASASVSSRYVVTDPGMLSLFNSKATLKVKYGAHGAVGKAKSGDAQRQSTKDDQVCAAVGQAKDVTGWLAGQSYTRITGMSDWTHLSTTQSKAGKSGGSSVNANDAVAFKDSDMWSGMACGGKPGDIKIEDGPDASKVVVIDFGKALEHGGAEVSMHWVRRDLPNVALPFYIAAGVLAVLMVLAASLLAMTPKKRKKKAKKPSSVEEVTVAEALTGSIEGLRRGLRNTAPGRHAKRAPEDMGAATDSNGTLAGSGPSIVDPSLHNLVAEAQDSADASNAEGETDEGDSAEIIQTDFITDSQLDDYFARLTSEGVSADADDVDEAADSVDSANAEGGVDTDDDKETKLQVEDDGKADAEHKPDANDTGDKSDTSEDSDESADADASDDGKSVTKDAANSTRTDNAAKDASKTDADASGDGDEDSTKPADKGDTAKSADKSGDTDASNSVEAEGKSTTQDDDSSKSKNAKSKDSKAKKNGDKGSKAKSKSKAKAVSDAKGSKSHEETKE